MIYVEGAPTVFLVKEDLSDYVICRDNFSGCSFLGREYFIYDYATIQEVIAPKALAWWSDD